MNRRALQTAALLLVTLGLAVGGTLADPAKDVPVKTPLQVTYFFLPG